MARLGGGRRCETWLCWSSEFLSPVAVKMQRPGATNTHETARRLQAEAQRVASLAHPCFQRVLATHVHHDVPHIVFEYVEGSSLRSLLDTDGPLQAVDVAVIGEQIAWALAYLHRRGLVHLDLKPQNILLRDGRPVIVDLGLARHIGTRPRNRLLGTAGYHAPEQLAGRPASTAMDVYTFGLVIHELLWGFTEADGRAVSDARVAHFDDIVWSLLGPACDRPSAAGVARSLGAVASELGDAPFCPR